MPNQPASLKWNRGRRALQDAIHRLPDGFAIGVARRGKPSPHFDFGGIRVYPRSGNFDLLRKYRDRFAANAEQVESADVEIFPARLDGQYYAVMDLRSFAFILTQAVNSDPSHYLRRNTTAKDKDD